MGNKGVTIYTDKGIMIDKIMQDMRRNNIIRFNDIYEENDYFRRIYNKLRKKSLIELAQEYPKYTNHNVWRKIWKLQNKDKWEVIKTLNNLSPSSSSWDDIRFLADKYGKEQRDFVNKQMIRIRG